MSARLLHTETPTSEAPTPRLLTRRFHWSPRMMCLTTKPVIVILLWVFTFSCVLKAVQYAGSLVVLLVNKNDYDPIAKFSFMYFAGFYAFMAAVTASYPIGGFLGDVYCGRYKTVAMSMGILWVSLFLLCMAAILAWSIQHHEPHYIHIVEFILCGIAFLLFIPGTAGFYSNMTQLSLDQLRDAPSHTLGIFLHWSVWVDQLGAAVIHIMFVIAACFGYKKKFKQEIVHNVGLSLPFGLFLLVSILLVVNCFTKHRFYAADIHYNPYKVLLNVLKYVKAHKHPVRHSALHWTNGEQPSRFDFAKECYGGPFTSSQVEDVKTLGRVVLVLLAVGPVFVLCVPTSYFIFPLFSFHVTGQTPSTNSCSYEWILVESGTLSHLIGLVAIPLITWIVYCVLKNRVPRILTRMTIGITLFILSVLAMFLIDLAGHITTTEYSHITNNNTTCLFLETFGLTDIHPYDTQYRYNFGFSWYVLIIPNCFTITSYSLLVVTLLEFISAQAPQPMKGLVFGIFFAIKGGYNFLAAVSLFPFSLQTALASSSTISCGTSYFLLTLIVSIIGLGLFACASKRYKYRMRDEEPFSQAVIEEIFERRLQYSDHSPDIAPDLSEESESGRGSRRPECVSVSEEVRASEWFVPSGESSSVQDRQFSLSHEWYGTFQYNDSERRQR